MSISLKIVRQLACSLLLGVLAQAAFAQLHIDIKGVGSKQIPIAIANFTGDATPPTDIPQVVRDDLLNSGLFRIVDADVAPIGESAAIDNGAWRSRGAVALVTGSITRLVDGRYDVRFRLYDVANQSAIGALSLTGSASNPRQTAHNLADYVFEKLTGVRGVFSTRIAYVIHRSRDKYELQISDADGKNPHSAFTSPEPIISPAWSPDGTKLAYVSFYEQRKPVVFVHTIVSGNRVPVANFKGSNSAPAWSPDGQTLAVVLTKDGNSQIYLMNSDGSNAHRLTQSGGIDTEPVFAPDGQSIYFTSDRGGGPQIYRMPVNGGEATRVTFSGDYNVSPRISPDGKTLAYVARRTNRFQITVLDLATSQELVLTDTAKDESPSFAPNGMLLLYATEVGGRGVLAASSVDGVLKLRFPLDDSGDVREPAWGPFLK